MSEEVIDPYKAFLAFPHVRTPSDVTPEQVQAALALMPTILRAEAGGKMRIFNHSSSGGKDPGLLSSVGLLFEASSKSPKLTLYVWIEARAKPFSWTVKCAERFGWNWKLARESHFTIPENDPRVQQHVNLNHSWTRVFAVAINIVGIGPDVQTEEGLSFSRDIIFAARSLRDQMIAAWLQALDEAMKLGAPGNPQEMVPVVKETFIRDE